MSATRAGSLWKMRQINDLRVASGAAELKSFAASRSPALGKRQHSRSPARSFGHCLSQRRAVLASASTAQKARYQRIDLVRPFVVHPVGRFFKEDETAIAAQVNARLGHLPPQEAVTGSPDQ